MMPIVTLLLLSFLPPDGSPPPWSAGPSAWDPPFLGASLTDGMVGGLVVNGSRNQQPMAGVEVVVRAVRGGELVPMGTAVSDEHGHFTIAGLPAVTATEYVTGVNHEGIHYPGPRLVLTPEASSARVRLVAYDALTEPSPLVAERHEMNIEVTDKVLEVTETLVITNPSLRGYVGAPREEPEMADLPPFTLTLQPCPGFGTVTFHEEFLGRNFSVRDSRLYTSLPWPPGTREIRFSYRLPIEHRHESLRRVLDLPCGDLRVRLQGLDRNRLQCVLPQQTLAYSDADDAWSYRGEPLAIGETLELQLRDLPVEALSYGKWIAVMTLALLLTSVAGIAYWRRTPAPPAAELAAVAVIAIPTADERVRKPRRPRHHARSKRAA